MIIGTGDFQYEWIDNWAQLPDTESTRENGRTHGIAALGDGRIVVYQDAKPSVLIFNRQGELEKSWGNDFASAHGITVINEQGKDILWLADCAQVFKTTLDGEILLTLPAPDHDVYSNGGHYVPTWVAINEQSKGGCGDIWVADGYGSSLVHRYDKTGKYIGAISGQLGEAGRFACPHGIAFDFRNGKNELYVADRGNQRVQVFDSEGNFKRVVGAFTLHSPCMFDFQDDYCLVPQLKARVDILGKHDNVVAMLGDNGHTSTLPGWPNHNIAGHSERIKKGFFNSPHGACFGQNGDIYVAEWIIGGRVTKLKKL